MANLNFVLLTLVFIEAVVTVVVWGGEVRLRGGPRGGGGRRGRRGRGAVLGAAAGVGG